MKTKWIAGILIVALVTTSIGVAVARNGQGNGASYVDADNDGVCDNFGINGRDDDGDGVPNGQDDDYVRPRDGSGKHSGNRCGCNR